MLVLLNPPFSARKTQYCLNYYKDGPYPHPSLAYLAGYLQKKDIPVRIIDAKFHKMSPMQVIETLNDMKPEIVGVTSSTTEINDVHRMITEIKANLPETFTIMGGVHASALPIETITDNKDLDAVAVGEGEFILEKLASAGDIYKALPSIKGLAYRKNGIIERTPPQEYGENMYEYGKAAFHLWPKARFYHILTYRGCPFSCSFCFRVFGKKARLRKMEDVVDELEYIASNALGARTVISDSTFGLSREYTVSILENIIKRGISAKLRWNCFTRVDVIDKELLKLIKRAGCIELGVGIESGSDHVLRSTGKNIMASTAQRVVEEAKEMGMKTCGYYIFGHVNETKAEIGQTVRMIHKVNTDEATIGIMVPWPGTKVYELAKNNQGGYRLLSKDYSKYDKYFGSTLEFKNFDMDYLESMRVKAYLYLYIKNRRFIDLLRFLYSYRGHIVKKILHLIKRSLTKKTNRDGDGKR
ncbi:B12-binding domain-containing radical SAM protein [Candidatus Omnitrophota bacterium]